MDIFCYGLLRSAIVYLMTIGIAFVPAYYLWKIFADRRPPKPKSYDPHRPNIHLTDLLVALVFFIGFGFGIAWSNTFMQDKCGFSPDMKGYEQEQRIDDIQYEMDLLQMELEYQKRELEKGRQ